jgi:hypothetical protein
MRRQRMQASTRRRLAWLLAGFVAIQFGLALSAEWWPRLRDPEFTLVADLLAARRAETPGRPLVLALGSSRTSLGVRGSLLSSGGDATAPLVFNFGIPGSGPMMQEVCLRRLLDAGVRPDLVLVEIMPAYLGRRSSYPFEEQGLVPARLSAAELVALWPYYARKDKLLLPWLKARLLPCFGAGADLRGELARRGFLPTEGDVDPCRGLDSHGWRPLYHSVTPQQRERLTRLAHGRFDSLPGSSGLGAGPVRALHDLLHLCRARQLAVALVMPPEGSTFRALYTPALLAELDAVLAQLSREFDAPVWDARRWVDDGDFWDSHHLLPGGAARYTLRLGGELPSRWAHTRPGSAAP